MTSPSNWLGQWARKWWHSRLRRLDRTTLFPSITEQAHVKCWGNYEKGRALAAQCISYHIQIEPHWQHPEEWSAADHAYITETLGADKCP